MGLLDSIDKKYHAWIYGGGFLLLLLIVLSLISSSEKARKDAEISFPALVLIKSDRCGHCTRFMPVWEKLSKSGLKNGATGAPVKFIKVDIDNTSVSSKFPETQGVPSIRYHYSYDNFVEYEGDRSYESLVAFIKESEMKKEGYAGGVPPIASSPPTGTGADPSKGKGAIVKAPDAKTKGMLPATVPGAPASGTSLTPNRASFNMLSDKEYVPPRTMMPPSKRTCNKETSCGNTDYMRKPSGLGSGIDPKGQLFYAGGYLPTNLTDRAYPQAKRGGMFLVEHW
jgi:thiol-disulfide isomerase/thioredoxin